MGASKATAQILALRGICDSGSAQVALKANGSPQLFMSGGANLTPFLQSEGWIVQPVLLSAVGEQARYSVKAPSLIINEIADPDSHGKVLKIASTFRKNFPKAPCINEPDAVLSLTRDEVYRRLFGLPGVIMPQTQRLNISSRRQVVELLERASGPVLLRKAGEHNGRNTVLLNSLADIEETDRLPLDGSAYYLTDFVDFRSADGLYRKYRLVVIGGEVFLRHMIAGRNWMVHAESRLADYASEEAAALAGFDRDIKPRIAETCAAIAETLGLDYFGVDCALMDNSQLLIFEANANMNVLVNSEPRPNMFEKPVARIIQALSSMLATRMAV